MLYGSRGEKGARTAGNREMRGRCYTDQGVTEGEIADNKNMKGKGYTDQEMTNGGEILPTIYKRKGRGCAD